MRFWQWVPMLLLLIPIAIMIGLILLWGRRGRQSGKRSPLTQDLLRSPGESLREQLWDVDFDIAITLGFSAMPPILAYVVYLSTRVFESKEPTVIVTVLASVVGIGGLAWFGRRLWIALELRRNLRLGYEAEVAVGQELNQLGLSGFHAFHDIPAKSGAEFNIDHVLVGRTGVFAIETKGRAKPGNRTESAHWEVGYDGKTLKFPGWQESEPLEQAQRQAKWVSKWLTAAVGETVSAQPVLVLPGWFIRKTEPTGMLVLNATQIQSYFPKAAGSTHLSDQLVRRIVHQLDQRCRNVAPSSHKSASDQKT
jgi:Nuclease-related domain